MVVSVRFALIGLCLAALAAEPYPLDRRVPCDTSRLDGTPEPPPPFRTRRVLDQLKLAFPVHLFAEPGSDRLLVVQLAGKVVAFKNQPNVAAVETYLDLADYDLYSLAFHPNYAANGQVFVFANGPRSKGNERFNRIYRFIVRGEPKAADLKSQTLIIEWKSNGHNGGDLLFGPDGLLHITSGDGTSDSDTDLTGQDLSNLCSGLIRIDPDRPDPGRNYGIPKDNPFLTLPGARPELYAFGFRNPWRIALDPKSKTMWIGDVGQDIWEMVHLLKKGANYGWSVYEGGQPFYLNRKLGPGPVVPPTIVHHHSEARSITGGQFYQGKQFPELRDTYVYGDYATGKIWGMRHDDGKVLEKRELAGTRLQMVAFGLDHQGELYIVDHPTGQIHQLERREKPTARAAWPRRLSETGLYLDTARHRTQPGLIPYSVNSPLWSDGAFKERFIALPGTSAITFHETGFWKFPEGTALVKTFSLEREAGNTASRKRIETRILTFQGNEWQGYSFRWNDAETDADLVPAGGADQTLSIQDANAPGGQRQQVWHFPSRSECMVCHSRAANYVLGLSTMQMNRDHDYGSEKVNQLIALGRLGALRFDGAEHVRNFEARSQAVLDTVRGCLPLIPKSGRDRLGKTVQTAAAAWWAKQRPILNQAQNSPTLVHVPPKLTAGYPRLPDPSQPGEITARARSYLHANCAHCHVWAGGGNAMINLSFTAKPSEWKLIDEKPLHDSFGLPDARIVAPGAPERSTLLHRVQLRGRGQMPPLASAVVDDAAVRLLQEWIRSLPASSPPAPAKP